MVFSYQPLLPSDLWTKTGKKFGSLIEFTSTKPEECLENSCVVRHHNVLFCYVLPLTILLPPIIYFGLSPYRHNKCQEMKAAVQTARTKLCKLRAPSINGSSKCKMCNCTVHQEPRKVLLHNCQGMSKRPAAAPRTHLNAAANRLTTKESWRKVRLRAEKRSKPCWELERASKIFATPSLAMFVKFRFILETNLLLNKSNAMKGLQRAHSNGDDNTAVQENQCRLVPRNHSHGLK